MLRQFHVEGFVNEYTLDSVSADGKLLEFTTVRIENVAPGWRAKEFFRVLSPDEFVETFSLAAPGKPFEVYSETKPPNRDRWSSGGAAEEGMEYSPAIIGAVSC